MKTLSKFYYSCDELIYATFLRKDVSDVILFVIFFDNLQYKLNDCD